MSYSELRVPPPGKGICWSLTDGGQGIVGAEIGIAQIDGMAEDEGNHLIYVIYGATVAAILSGIEDHIHEARHPADILPAVVLQGGEDHWRRRLRGVREENYWHHLTCSEPFGAFKTCPCYSIRT